jgi:pyridoxine 4-dehydrogenase
MSDTVLLSAARAGTVKVGDFEVNRLGFGAMRVTGRGIWGKPEDPEAARAVLRRAVELGVNFIDTADAYGPEVSENLIREALAPYTEHPGLVIATKGGLLRGGPGDWSPNGHPDHLREACEASLKRLGVDQIQIYQFHRPDPEVPYEDSIQALIGLQKEGKIKHIGVSNVTLDLLKQATAMTNIVSVQNHYNFEHRKDSEAVLQYCQEQGIAFIPYFPIGGNQGGVNEAKVKAVADKHSASGRQIALAWILKHSPATLPIPGTSSVPHLESNIAAANITLDDEDMAALDALTD